MMINKAAVSAITIGLLMVSSFLISLLKISHPLKMIQMCLMFEQQTLSYYTEA